MQEKFENNTILLKTLKKAVEDKTLEKVGGYGLQHILSLYVPGVHMMESPAFELSRTAANGKWQMQVVQDPGGDLRAAC